MEETDEPTIYAIPKFMGAVTESSFAYGDTILEVIADARVFRILKNSDGSFDLIEGCDNHFSVLFTKEQIVQLGKELIALAE